MSDKSLTAKGPDVKALSKTLEGNFVINKKGKKVSMKEVSKNEVIGVYFSAHWCPPCRKFTPLLSQRFDHWRNERNRKVTVIFVSSDKNESEFEDYYHDNMGDWYAIPFDDKDRSNKLQTKLNPNRTIPTFILLDNKGDILTEDGRGVVQNDENSLDFPWKDYQAPYRPPNVWMRVFFRIFMFIAVVLVYRYYYGGQPRRK